MPLRLGLFCLAACADPVNVVVQGVTLAGLRAELGPRPDVSVTALDADLVESASVRSGEDGAFRIEVPQGARVYLVLGETPEEVPASFAGVSGFNPRLRVDNGLLTTVRPADLTAELAAWAGCPGLEEGGMTLGEVQVDGLIAEETGEPLRVTTAIVEVTTAEGEVLPACYLDEEGRYQAGLPETGATARFLVPNIPTGLHEMSVSWRPAGTNRVTETYVLYMPENGVAPRFPLYVRFDP